TVKKTPTKSSPVPASLRRATSQARHLSPIQNRTRRGGPIKRILPPTPTRPLSSIDDVFSSPSSSSSVPDLTSSPISIASSDVGYEPTTPVHVKITPMSKEDMPDSWFFTIHEETPEESLQNLVDFSTSILDISDESDTEESSASKELEKRGK